MSQIMIKMSRNPDEIGWPEIKLPFSIASMHKHISEANT